MAARTMPDPTPTPWGPTNQDGNLATLDALVCRDDGGLITVDGPAAELAALVGHLGRRADAAGRVCVVADGRRCDEPWREVALALGLSLELDSAATARAILRGAGDAVIVVNAVAPSAWGEALAAELAHQLDPNQAPTIVLLGHRKSEGIVSMQLDSVAAPQDLACYYQALIEGSRDRVASFAALGSLDSWWKHRGEDATMASASPAARRLLEHVLLAGRSCSRAMIAVLSGPVALDELATAGKVELDGERVRLTTAAIDDSFAVDLNPQAALEVASALLAHEADAWAAMRAAELFAFAGDLARAHAAAHAGLRRANDVALRADLWDRFDQALGGELEAEALVRYGELALSFGDVAQALRLARRGDSQQSYPLALLAGRTSLARGDLRRAGNALSDALALAQDGEARAAAELELAELDLVRGDRPASRAHAERAIAATDDLAIRLAAQNVIGKTLLAEGEWDEAVDRFTRDEEQALSAGRDLDALRARLNRSIAIMSQGRRLEAQALLEDILAAGEELGDRRATCFALANLSVLATLGHDYAEGIHLVEKAIEQMRPLGDTLRLARQIINLAGLRLSVGLVDEAEQALAFGRQACGSNLGDALVCNLSLVKAKVHLAKGNTLQAASAAEEAIAAASRSSDGAKLGEACRLGARVALEDGDVLRASRYLDRSEEAARGPAAEAERRLIQASIERAKGNPFGELAAEALTTARDDDDIDLGREARELCAWAAFVDDDVSLAREHLAAAKRLRDRVLSSLPEELRRSYAARREISRLGDLDERLAAARATEVEDAQEARRPAPRRRRSSQFPAERRSLVGESEAMRALRAAIAKVGKSPTTVLVHGESGTGKELVADALHCASDRADGPLVKVNCAALVETLLLSELFGHEKGAFTGAASRKRGRFEQAHGGTIFLDEIGDISPKTQVALLRVLQERSFERVGGTSPISVDVRVVCATHRDLRSMVAAGTFREDLYYRLAGVTLDVPSLRARLDDLSLLAEALLERIATEQGMGNTRMSDEAAEALRRYPWPGNVRELENALRAAALFSEGDFITVNDFTDNVASLADLGSLSAPPSGTRPRLVSSPTEAVYAEVRGGQSLPDLKKQLERACIQRALEETGGNITKAAKLLGMKRPRVSQLVNQFAREEVGS